MNDTAEKPTPTAVAVLPQREVRVVQDVIPVMDTGKFDHMFRIANAMYASSLMPSHLKGTTEGEGRANMFLVVNQAVRWGMDPFALAQHAYVLSGKLGYEGKVIAALVNASGKLRGGLEYDYSGAGADRTVTVSGTTAAGKTLTISGKVGTNGNDGWVTNNAKWKSMPDQMLAYRGAREWARRHMPEVMLGIYSDDEIEDMGRLRRDDDGTYVPAPPLREPIGDRPAPATATAATVDNETGEVTGGDAAEATFALYGSTGALMDTIAKPMDYAKRLDRLFAEVDAATEQAIKEHNADGIQRLIDEGHKDAMALLGLQGRPAAKKKAAA